jgi:Cu2+-exporting ATPase
MSTIACFHCGEPIPTDVRLRARIADRDHYVCCIGCRAAVEWIATLGLQDYYRLRETPAERAGPIEDYSAWDRPQVQRLHVRQNLDGHAEACVLVEGLRCAACSWLIERALRDVPGVHDVSVNPAARRLRIMWSPDTIALSAILGRLARLGYVPHPISAEALDALGQREQRAALKRLVVAGLGMMQAMMYAVALYAGAFEGMNPSTRDFFRWIGLLVTTPVMLYAAPVFFIGAWREWRARQLGMDTPVALAVGLVYLASIFETLRGGSQVYFDSASMFVFLLLSGRYLEMRARHRAADVVDALARLQPALAQRRASSGALETVGVYELETGDTVIVAAGSAIPADGVLLSPTCLVDEALLTGESTSQQRRCGETLIAGSVARSGPIQLRVVHIGTETVLSSIVRLAAHAQQQRPHWARLGDRFAARFVAGVLVLSLATACAWLLVDPSRAFAATLSVLVVSCPCAFALSAPTALTRAMAVLACQGVLILKPDALEKLVRANHFVFDKTGTLTHNRLELAAVTPLSARSAQACLALAAQLEQANSHPIALAIRAATTGASYDQATALRNIAGAGVEGEIGGQAYRLGRGSFACAIGHSSTPADDDDVVLADCSGSLARFSFREAVREDAIATIAALRCDGVGMEIMSGDSASRVATLAAGLGFADFRARMSPAQKLDRLEALRDSGRIIAMVGDGINDAPVLAGADVAVALGGGAQLAQSRADIVLAGDRLGALIDARTLAQRTLRVLRQNLYWAAGYNFTLIPLAALGWVSPWLAAIGMSTSSLFVILNALRIAAPRKLPFVAPSTANRPTTTTLVPA